MNAKIVTVFRKPTGETHEKTNKWDGTCFTCTNRTKRGFCNNANSWDAEVRTPDQYCEAWEGQIRHSTKSETSHSQSAVLQDARTRMSDDMEMWLDEDLELTDEDDPEVFEFNEVFVKALHRLGIRAQAFLDAWSESIDESNQKMLREGVVKNE